MMPVRIIAIIGFIFILLTPHANGANADAIVGLWSMKDREAQFSIYKCGSEYCGKISYLSEPNYPPTKKGLAGLPKMDLRNPDPQLRERSLVGLPFLEGFHFTDENTWEGGRIYNPDDGQKYRCKLWLDGENRLKVRGYLGIPALGKTETWVR